MGIRGNNQTIMNMHAPILSLGILRRVMENRDLKFDSKGLQDHINKLVC